MLGERERSGLSDCGVCQGRGWRRFGGEGDMVVGGTLAGLETYGMYVPQGAAEDLIGDFCFGIRTMYLPAQQYNTHWYLGSEVS